MTTLSDADTIKQQGLLLFNQGAYDDALAQFQQAADAYGLADNKSGQAEMKNNMGVIYRLQNNRPAALALLQEAEADFAQLDDDSGRAQVLANLGDLYASDGRRNQAANCYGDSAELFSTTGDGERQYQVLRTYSLMQVRQRRWVEAMDLMAKALQARPKKSVPQHLFYPLLRLALKLLSGG